MYWSLAEHFLAGCRLQLVVHKLVLKYKTHKFSKKKREIPAATGSPSEKILRIYK